MKKLWKCLALVLVLCMLGGCGSGANGEQTDNPLTETNAGGSSAGLETRGSENDESDAESDGQDGEEPAGDIGVWAGIAEDADAVEGVPAEDGQGTYPTYQVEISQLSGELVKEVLLGGRNISIKEAEANALYPDQTNDFYTCQDGTYVENQFGRLLFVTPEAEYWPAPGLFMEDDFLKKIFPDGQDLVLAQTDWDYADMQQAKQLVAGYLDRLGVEYGSEWITFGVSGEKMTAAMHQAYPDTEYPEEIVEVYMEGTWLWKKTYDADDDVYIMRIPLALEGHLMTDVDRINLFTEQLLMRTGCFAYAMVGQEGLRYLEIRWILDAVGQSEERTLITQEQAIQAVEDYIVKEKAKYRPSDVDAEFVVTEVKFSYVPYLYGDGKIDGEVFPCWEVRGEDFFEEPNYTVAVNVDAVTGEVRNISRVYDEDNYSPIRIH